MRNKHGDQPSCPIAFWLNSLYLTSDNARPTEVESLVSGEGKVIKFKICHLVYKLITQFALLFRFLSKSFAIEYFTWTCRFEWSGKVGKSIFFFCWISISVRLSDNGHWNWTFNLFPCAANMGRFWCWNLHRKLCNIRCTTQWCIRETFDPM